MNKQMKAELSWKIPFEIYKVLGTFDIFELGKISLNKYIDIFEKYKLHRFKKISAEIFYSAVQRIINVYNGDISPDMHINRVLRRMGFIPQKADNTMIIYKARELNPEFPGIIDFSCWEIGRNYCRQTNPDCKNCIVKDECEKNIR